MEKKFLMEGDLKGSPQAEFPAFFAGYTKTSRYSNIARLARRSGSERSIIIRLCLNRFKKAFAHQMIESSHLFYSNAAAPIFPSNDSQKSLQVYLMPLSK